MIIKHINWERVAVTYIPSQFERTLHNCKVVYSASQNGIVHITKLEEKDSEPEVFINAVVTLLSRTDLIISATAPSIEHEPPMAVEIRCFF